VGVFCPKSNARVGLGGGGKSNGEDGVGRAEEVTGGVAFDY